MSIFFANCTHLLTRTQEKKFEDVFLVKIANKGTTLRCLSAGENLHVTCCNLPAICRATTLRH